MTDSIVTYFDDLERAILQCGAISAYVVHQREVTPIDGKLREIEAYSYTGGQL